MERKLICPICGKGFIVSGNAQKFCSSECRYIAHKAKPKGEREFICSCCGDKFKSIKKKKYCSVQCSNFIHGRTTERKKRVTKGPSLSEIGRLALAEGLSYGEYCLKYGLY